jgi:peptidase E
MSGVIYLLAGNPHARGRLADPAMRAFFDEAGAVRPRVAYIGAASGDDLGFFEAMRARLQANGAGEVDLVPLCGGTDETPAALRLLAQADAVFVSGGDVCEGLEALRARPEVVASLRRRYEAGVPFMGLSAGSIMLSRAWVRWAEAPGEDDALVDGLGFAPLYCDVHGEAEGWDELNALLRLLPAGTLGYGIRAGGALRVCGSVVENV